MVGQLERSGLAAHIVDGPKGPAGIIKAGVVSLARAAGAVVVPIYTSSDRAWYFNSWIASCCRSLREGAPAFRRDAGSDNRRGNETSRPPVAAPGDHVARPDILIFIRLYPSRMRRRQMESLEQKSIMRTILSYAGGCSIF